MQSYNFFFKIEQDLQILTAAYSTRKASNRRVSENRAWITACLSPCYGRSKHYLPTLKASIKRFFRPFSSVFTFLSPNSDFHYLKLRLSRGESSVLKRAVPELIYTMFKCKLFSTKTKLMQLFTYSLSTFIHSVFALVTLYILNYIYYYNNIYNL